VQKLGLSADHKLNPEGQLGVLTIVKAKSYVQNFGDPGFQFERLMTGEYGKYGKTKDERKPKN